MLKVVILEIIPELNQEEFNILLPLVTAEKQGRINKYRSFQDARNCLLGDILTRYEICSHTGLFNNHLTFSSTENGKPCLADRPNIHFNISHTGNYVACAISNEPVGVDIEIIKLISPKIAERFFTQDEIAYIDTTEDVFRFYEVWTKKESFIKFKGKGLHMPLSSFSVINSESSLSANFHKVFQSHVAVGYVCSPMDTPPNVYKIDIYELLQNILNSECFELENHKY
ncbi:MAG: 4'-phosphopantetheinyl transferase superfamily protein [Defluviitaleaceae bacterium]|nr:4'-phosphopantetheinyl transferase superfamily protein [Defluviitaleaceae bacterium]